MNRWSSKLRAPWQGGSKACCKSVVVGHLKTRIPGKNMVKTEITISNKLGLHARASAKLTKLAGSFPCDVFMSKGERRINAKSIMGVMMLAAGMGSVVELETDGPQEQEALDALVALINDKFGEGQ